MELQVEEPMLPQVRVARRQDMVFQEEREEDQLLVPQDQWAKLGRVSLPHLHTKNEWKVGTDEIEITHHFNYFSLHLLVQFLKE